ncbi:PQQ-dependent catabolism-associated CXXCW motif protein [Pelagibius sp. Alg239-R121]|uniref:PQQ-dependent catabolism-associated CXXCW motif protein n=1 Tax=Pelagibius sp. Alg239-R121 TaxID=2993448 RepID=UPI002AC326EA|nr:PQQ-dependent catabolism-associated CXXCW motif protein [Pelagibius sp. Alg239-R121]
MTIAPEFTFALVRRITIASALALGLWSLENGAHAQAVEELAGYRMEGFRAPVPDRLTGAEVVSTEEVMDLHEAGGIIFIDVLPRPPKPKKLPKGTVWRPRPRSNIPGSVWLPNVGFGALNPEAESYFQDSLAQLTKDDKAAPILIYCLSDCWMSWNAAKRALSYGYAKVYWYPDGTDGWTGFGGDVEPSEPVPMAE